MQIEFEVARSKKDADFNHKCFLEQSIKFMDVKYQVVEEQFNLLYQSIQNLSDAKNLEDKYKHEIFCLNGLLEDQTDEVKHCTRQVGSVISERDKYRLEAKNLLDTLNRA